MNDKNNKFESLDLDPRLLKNLNDLNFKSMTPIQHKSLPHIMHGADVMAQAKTGSGKTAAFVLGILNTLDVKQTRPLALILCPTRELAEQVANETRTLARVIPNVKVLTITGGKSEYQQIRSLDHGAHIVVGTPGRVLKLLKKRVLNFTYAKYYVLDEADRMLDMGFSEDIFKITTFIPKVRQTLLFSATFPEDIEELSGQLQRSAIRVSVDTSHAENVIQEEFLQLNSHKDKVKALLKVLKKYQSQKFIIFCKMKRIADTVADELYDAGVMVSSIHGDLEQIERTEVLTKFSNNSLLGVVATDVAARGIDIKDLDLVVNLDLPSDPEVYVHRIGRTGRAGKIGRAISFLTSHEIDKCEKIFEYKKQKHEIIEFDATSTNEDSTYSIKPLMRTLIIFAGKRDKLRPGDIVGAIVGESGIDSKEIGEISVLKSVSYVALKAELAELVCDKLNSGKIKKRNFRVEID